MKKASIILMALLLAVTVAGCSKRRIDKEETGSVNVPGTSWQIFCDGPNAVMWVPGVSGDADEIEAYVYDHYKCAPQFYEENPGVEPQFSQDPAQSDPDGIIEDDE
jgi:hypothetical protein